jgi:hypothetical protein
MAPPKHTTHEQRDWLLSRRPQFLDYQKEKQLLEFWSALDHDWFTHWPEPGVAEAEHEPEGHPLHNKAAATLKGHKLVGYNNEHHKF